MRNGGPKHGLHGGTYDARWTAVMHGSAGLTFRVLARSESRVEHATPVERDPRRFSYEAPPPRARSDLVYLYSSRFRSNLDRFSNYPYAEANQMLRFKCRGSTRSNLVGSTIATSRNGSTSGVERCVRVEGRWEAGGGRNKVGSKE
ncbi:hypothetical protein MUK42_34319 [Musa troglodytarum]|uniref:Uncharacterized protein n=1 Tax=Musa troglodytarum TaxID=320322 RepID=A0A9E7K6V2_9LILI|nr:hypothetical protein MUK42_34319 [Musa troglodytarum]